MNSKNGTHEQVIKALNDLIDVCLDGADGYRTAAEALTAGGIRSLFSEYAEKRRKFSEELQAEVKNLGLDQSQSGDHGWRCESYPCRMQHG
jgi:uncharacterized protein (TIGR02284 family)